ncbi:hypothetical protein [Pseudanabaena sp. FACHB-2040]|uniref:hypothetical protein n=1 Tax=Pseudanabaena sp. FACHB-2040 TaxID=2692859 RepID=UPI00168242AC|nr:hypothetical protein [Pseudanabaena sp. FACHB-2040]MBD2261247.1 hypothetical protein [Pseudanabaena sp. FACHB-2040]
MHLFHWHIPLLQNSDLPTQVVDRVRSTLGAPLSLFERLQGNEPSPTHRQVPSDVLLKDLGITVFIILLIYLVLGTIIFTIQVGIPWFREQFAHRAELYENLPSQSEALEISRQAKRQDLIQEYVKDAIFVVLGAVLSFFLNKL